MTIHRNTAQLSFLLSDFHTIIQRAFPPPQKIILNIYFLNFTESSMNRLSHPRGQAAAGHISRQCARVPQALSHTAGCLHSQTASSVTRLLVSRRQPTKEITLRLDTAELLSYDSTGFYSYLKLM